MPRYNIYATLLPIKKVLLYSSPATTSVRRGCVLNPIFLPSRPIACHILCVIYSHCCIELVDKLTV
ncbi:hypothetical protein EB837_08100 [Kluyvera ascorbata]|uniref:Uncharacterized protein n=1 Tax=Kluyvera ascorbata TaxID=51288 RepID=A0A3N2S7Y0_9ENTR|nr:hypothetical protein EB837_08100 [Kluyvera ascorbata]